MLVTQKLLTLAEQIYPILSDEERSPAQKEVAIRSKVVAVPGFERTWAKIIVVGIDLAYPELRLLERQCPAGAGAVPSLRWLMGDGRRSEEQLLDKLVQIMNSSRSAGALDFWEALREQEVLLADKWKHNPVVAQALPTEDRQIKPSTLQLQRCEYRLLRQKYPLGRTIVAAIMGKRIRCKSKPALESASAESCYGESECGELGIARTKRRQVTKSVQDSVAPVGDLVGDLRIRSQPQLDANPVELAAAAYEIWQEDFHSKAEA